MRVTIAWDDYIVTVEAVTPLTTLEPHELAYILAAQAKRLVRVFTGEEFPEDPDLDLPAPKPSNPAQPSTLPPDHHDILSDEIV